GRSSTSSAFPATSVRQSEPAFPRVRYTPAICLECPHRTVPNCRAEMTNHYLSGSVRDVHGASWRHQAFGRPERASSASRASNEFDREIVLLWKQGSLGAANWPG